MPIHIREIVVKATIADGTAEKPKLFGRAKQRDEAERASIVQECMDNMLRIMKEQKDR